MKRRNERTKSVKSWPISWGIRFPFFHWLWRGYLKYFPEDSINRWLNSLYNFKSSHHYMMFSISNIYQIESFTLAVAIIRWLSRSKPLVAIIKSVTSTAMTSNIVDDNVKETLLGVKSSVLKIHVGFLQLRIYVAIMNAWTSRSDNQIIIGKSLQFK